MSVGGVRGVLLPLLALACGGEANDAESAVPPQYAVVSRNQSEPTRVFSISTLEARGRAELEAAQQQGGAEYPESDVLFPWLHEGTLLQISEDRQSFTEIFVEPSGVHQPGGTYSLAELGFQRDDFLFGSIGISRDKAYFINARSQRILVWDLEAMAPGPMLSLGIEPAPGYTSVGIRWLPVVNHRLTVLTNSTNGEGIALDTIVTVIDTQTDEVLSQQPESRCIGLVFVHESSSGDRYFATSPGLAGAHLAEPDRYPAPCILRIRAGQAAFDPTWQGSLSDAVGSSAWGVLPWRKGAGLLVHVASERQARRAHSDSYAEVWQSWLVQPDGSEARELAALPLVNALISMVPDGERRYLAELDTEGSEWTYTDITDPDRPRPAISMPAGTTVWRIRSIDHLFP